MYDGGFDSAGCWSAAVMVIRRRRKSETRREGVSFIVAWREKQLCPPKESVWFVESVYAGLR
jgi:hypothetical protein